MNEIMERVRFSHIPHAETDNPALVAWHEEMEKELNVQVAAMVMEKHIKHNLTGLDWKTLQENDPIIQHVLKWKQHNSNKNVRKDKNNTDQHTLEEYLLTVVNTALLFVVPACKCQAALDLCHLDVGHQGRDRMYSLLQERFWWPKMRTQMMMTLQNCKNARCMRRKTQKCHCAVSPQQNRWTLCTLTWSEWKSLWTPKKSPWYRRYWW